MKDRSTMVGMAAAVVATLAVSAAMYTTARAQTGTASTQTGPPSAGPRGINGQDLQQRPNPGPFAQQGGGGGGAIAADQGVVYVLRGNAVFVLGRDAQTGRMRVFDQVELPNGRANAGQNPFRPNGQQQTRPGGESAPKK